MTKFISVLAAATALATPAFAGPYTTDLLYYPDLPFVGVAPAEVLTQPLQRQQEEAVNGQGIVATLGYDPFNPYPQVRPIQRTRSEVFVTDETTTCSGRWSMPCPVVIQADGSRTSMILDNYTHTGPRQVTVERIEYPISVNFGDGSTVHHVVVEE